MTGSLYEEAKETIPNWNSTGFPISKYINWKTTILWVRLVTIPILIQFNLLAASSSGTNRPENSE
jgi:hypothetical protein